MSPTASQLGVDYHTAALCIRNAFGVVHLTVPDISTILAVFNWFGKQLGAKLKLKPMALLIESSRLRDLMGDDNCDSAKHCKDQVQDWRVV